MGSVAMNVFAGPLAKDVLGTANDLSNHDNHATLIFTALGRSSGMCGVPRIIRVSMCEVLCLCSHCLPMDLYC